MKAITTFVSGLLLSAVLLLPFSVRAADLQPFFSLKISSVNTLISVAEKISTMAGFSDNAAFREIVTSVKDIRGINPDSIIGVAADVSSDNISLMLLLPITDLSKVEIPGRPDIFDAIQPFLTKKGNNFVINSPLGTYFAAQKKDYLVITPEDVADQVPADAKKLFADLEKYTIGFKIDLEKIDFETIEGRIFGPFQLIMAMQAPDAAESIDSIIEMYRVLYKEFRVIIAGIAFDPQTADVEYSGTAFLRKGSEMMAGYKRQPTMFSGFKGIPENVVFSIGESATQLHPSPYLNKAMEPSLKQYEILLSAALEQINEDDETGESGELAKKVFDSIQKIVELETQKKSNDFAGSLTTDGTLLFATTTNALEELRKLVSLAVDFVSQKLADVADDFDVVKALMKKNLQRNYVTVEGFKVSSFRFSIADMPIASLMTDGDFDALNDLTLGVLWAVKEGNSQAIAAAAGLDFAKTEQTFKSALEKTKTSVQVQPPIGMFSVQGLGKLLQKTIQPLIVKAGTPESDLATFKKVVDICVSAGSDATVTLNTDIQPDRMSGGYYISGKAIQAVISAVKLATEAAENPFNRSAVQDF